MRKIALEEHFVTPELAGYSLAGAHASMSEESFGQFEKRLWEFDEMRIEAMDKASIDLAVLSVTTPGVQAEYDARKAVQRAREVNDILAREIQKHPTRFAGFAHLPLQSAAAAAQELTRCVRELGFKGAMINGHTNGHYLDEQMYLPFWECVQDLGVPVYLHPRDPYDLPHVYLGHPELLGATWSWTMETAAHALRMVLGGTFTRFPKLTLLLGHMGEALPYLLWRLDSRARIQSRQGRREHRPPSEIIRQNIMVTSAGMCSHPALLCALSALGDDRVLFSADYPYEDSCVAAQFIESAPVSEAVRAKICHGNAERILGLAVTREIPEKSIA